MLWLAVEPDYEDDEDLRKYRKQLKNWDKKLDRVDDEVMIYIRERINYLLEVRSQKYMEELENQNKNIKVTDKSVTKLITVRIK